MLCILALVSIVGCAKNANVEQPVKPPFFPKVEIHQMLLAGHIRIVEDGFDDTTICEHMKERYQKTVNSGIKDILENDLDGIVFNERVYTAWRLGCDNCGVSITANHKRISYCEHVWNKIDDILKHGVKHSLSIEELAEKSLEIKLESCQECD